MAQALLPDDLWSLIEEHLPAHSRSPKGRRPRINDRAALMGFLFVLKTEYLGNTCRVTLGEAAA